MTRLIACGKCGQTHPIGECPPKLCRICKTVHKVNPPFQAPFCERNDTFIRKSKEMEDWARENFTKIMAQPDKEEEEDS